MSFQEKCWLVTHVKVDPIDPDWRNVTIVQRRTEGGVTHRRIDTKSIPARKVEEHEIEPDAIIVWSWFSGMRRLTENEMVKHQIQRETFQT